MSDADPKTLPYWKTGRSAPETWLDKCVTEIERAGGMLTARGDVMEGKAQAFLLAFSLEGEEFRFVWAIPDHEERGAARRQAATALYHTVKAKCVHARFHGARAAFMSELLIEGKPINLPKLMQR